MWKAIGCVAALVGLLLVTSSNVDGNHHQTNFVYEACTCDTTMVYGHHWPLAELPSKDCRGETCVEAWVTICLWAEPVSRANEPKSCDSDMSKEFARRWTQDAQYLCDEVFFRASNSDEMADDINRYLHNVTLHAQRRDTGAEKSEYASATNHGTWRNAGNNQHIGGRSPAKAWYMLPDSTWVAEPWKFTYCRDSEYEGKCPPALVDTAQIVARVRMEVDLDPKPY